MHASPFDQLTDKQRECLRLAADHMSSKEIARVLGISASAVEQRLKYAVRVVGARDRREAARQFAKWEQAGCGETTYGLPDVEMFTPPPQPAPVGSQGPNAWEAARLADSAGYFDPQWDRPLTQTINWPWPGKGRLPAQLSPLQRVMWIAMITVGLLLVFGVFVAGLEALSRLHG